MLSGLAARASADSDSSPALSDKSGLAWGLSHSRDGLTDGGLCAVLGSPERLTPTSWARLPKRSQPRAASPWAAAEHQRAGGR